MNTETQNALRAVAKTVISEYQIARKQDPCADVDELSRLVIRRHAKTAEQLGLNVDWLKWQIGVLTGVLTER